MSTKPAILIATTNRGKLREVLAVLADLPIDWVTLADFAPLPPPEEHGSSYAEIAAAKAVYYSRRVGSWALADDSGLEVDALGGAPGIHSARYAGLPSDDPANNRKLIEQLADVSETRRTARFRCAMALANGQEVVAVAEGRLDGLIVAPARGNNGFGYDPHFLVPERSRTIAELPSDLKNLISHRGQAVRAIRPALLRLVPGSGGSAFPVQP